MIRAVGEAAMVAGAVLTLLAGMGVLRFRDVFARMHALTKASTLGLLLVLLGAAFLVPEGNDVTFLVLAAALQLLTMPVGANLLARATYRASGIPLRVDTIDELAERGGIDPEPGEAPGESRPGR